MRYAIAGFGTIVNAVRSRLQARSMPRAAHPAEGSPPPHLGASVRRLRQRNGWSLHRMAQEAGVSAAAVYKIEKGRMVPSVTVLMKIARALKHSIADLLAPPEAIDMALIRAADRTEFRFAEFPVALQRLSGKLPDRKLEAGIYVIEPGVAATREPLTHGGEEIYLVLEGAIRFEVDGQPHLLNTGDALHLKGHLPHRWENAAPKPSRMLFVLTPPPFAPNGAEKEGA